MFDFLRKPLLWEAWDEELQREIDRSRPFSLRRKRFNLKSMQDLAVYRHLRDAQGQRIAEIGAGHSRVLPALAKANTCITVEKFEGEGAGPTRGRRTRGVRNVRAYLGEMSPELAPEGFDVVFSISVVEHVPDDAALAAFHADQLRILKPGGLFLHAIDMYLTDEPEEHQVHRFNRYREWVTASDGVEPISEVYRGDPRFTCDLATNPDNVMHSWGRAGPSLIGLRQRAQCVSVLVGGRKVSAAAPDASPAR